MHALIEPLNAVLLYALVRAGDLAICAAVARDILRAVIYGIVALLALVAMIVMVLAIH